MAQKIGALWKQKSKDGKKVYLKGTINDVKVVIFANDNKTSERSPDYNVIKSTPKNQGGGYSGSPPKSQYRDEEDPF